MENVFRFISEQPWVLVLFFAVFQVGAVVFTIRRLCGITKLWKDVVWNTNTDVDGLVLVEKHSGMSVDCETLIDDINKYISSHNGAVEFGVIRDKVDRKVDSMYEYATSMIQFPTYLGLLGTFIGVWVGLRCFQYGLVGGNDGVSNEMIRELMGGIIVSMLTSVVGLILMICTNFWAHRILKMSDKAQDDFYQFIQSDVIPELGTNVTSSLNRLQNTIRKFEPSFRTVIDDFKSAFADCADMFKGSFSDNVSVLTQAVNAMGSNMRLINENIEKQDQLLATLRQRSIVETLDKFVVAASSFDSVSETIAGLEDVRERISVSSENLAARQESYNRSLEIPEKLVREVNSVLDRVSIFERSLNEFGDNMNKTQLFRNEQLNLIEEQLRALKAKTNAVQSYQDTQVDELHAIYKEQTDAVNRLSVSFRQAVDKNGSDMEAAMREFQSVYDRIVNECRAGVERKLEEFSTALDSSLNFVDAGKKLDNLEKLQAIADSLEELRTAAVMNKTVLPGISAALQNVNLKLDNMGRRVSGAGATAAPSSPGKKGFFSRIFKKGRN